jgi:transcriptional regulator with XRE-family HTH domain
MSFAEWLRETRVQKGPSQDRLAEAARELDPKCSVYQGRLTEWENGKGVPNLRQFRATCRALELSEEETLAGREHWEAAQLHDEPSSAGVDELPTS